MPLPNNILTKQPISSDPNSLFAALDIGSNSFRMLLAQRIGNEMKILDRIKEQVRLAAGLDKQGNLKKETTTRALDCLSRMSKYLDGIPHKNIRAVATHALRAANNSDEFIGEARKHFPAPIKIISGQEEARLIFQGAAHTSHVDSKVMIIDIGGGSTEFAIGENMLPAYLASRPMGCINFGQRFFKGGEIARLGFHDAVITAEKEIEAFRNNYLEEGWEQCLGSSGSIKAISNILDKRSITLEHLLDLRDQLIAVKHIKNINIPGLSKSRAEILPAALAILVAAFKSLEIEQMEYCRGALREGVLYEMGT